MQLCTLKDIALCFKILYAKNCLYGNAWDNEVLSIKLNSSCVDIKSSPKYLEYFIFCVNE